ncbi:hypothetical protein M9H77_29644 [Catharanthus roseus]|uniref:Uncharacterized protein n=1 Tax=Catharanthus roseus TaxID=4058 RepID=A0ACB9ZXL7_CATRO|nr:hypothetical protein M9H77_29644 [Catharanthus roseus]
MDFEGKKTAVGGRVSPTVHGRVLEIEAKLKPDLLPTSEKNENGANSVNEADLPPNVGHLTADDGSANLTVRERTLRGVRRTLQFGTTGTRIVPVEKTEDKLGISLINNPLFIPLLPPPMVELPTAERMMEDYARPTISGT